MSRWALALLALALAAAVGCEEAKPAPPATPEAALRARLGVPAGARQVVVFGQTAHLDIDWQKTFDDYYRTWVEQIFLDARRLLDEQPRAFYSVAEMAFLAHHLEVHPEEAAPLAAHAARGALRIVGGGVTSPDTMLPETELLVRDLLLGARFAEETLGVRPRAAWLPDSFGHSGTAPDVLAAAGYDSVAFARIDGAQTFYEELDHPGAPPKPGSTLEQLMAAGSADFVWRGPGGGEVLAHYFASGLYCTGDTIDYDEPMQYPGGHLGPFRGDDPAYTDGMIAGYVAALRPTARTPYLFVPVGCDFQSPKPRLIEYLDGHNRRQYPKTGVWAVAAPFEDYAALVGAHRAELPVIDAELSPYFMGFYGSRPGLKRRIREAARPFWAAETFAVALGGDGAARAAALRPALARLAWSDHHDFIPGTSTDAVVAAEQLPLLDAAEAAGQAALAEVAAALAARVPPAAGAVGRVVALNPAGVARSDVVEVVVAFAPPVADLALQARAAGAPVPLEVVAATPAAGGYGAATLRLAVRDLGPWSWRAIDLVPGAAAPTAAPTVALLDAAGQPASGAAVVRVVLQNERVRAQWDLAAAGAGFALTSLSIDGAEALAADSFFTTDYADDGGLWRLGQEMPGCALTPLAPAAETETVTADESGALTARVVFATPTTRRTARLDAGDAGLTLTHAGRAAVGTTRTVWFAFAADPGAPLRTSAPGGFLERTPERVYTPTYWPAVAWAAAGPFAVLLRQATGVRFGAEGTLELLALRDARQERCDLLGGTGSDPEAHEVEWRLVRAETAALAEAAAQTWNRPVVVVAAPPPAAAPDLPAEQSLAALEGDGVLTALKPADRGDGVILRALLLPGPATVRLGPALAGRHAVRVDAAERDLEDLGPAGDTLTLDAARYGAIATVRLR
ncbi:MAG TPA: hypothetical protein VGQ83_25375 [Polyangia bacterium]|jgi:hypothetical protein